MRLSDLIVEADEYTALGFDPNTSAIFQKYKLPAKYAVYYKGMDPKAIAAELERDHLRGVINRAKDRTVEKLIGWLPKIAQSNAPITSEVAAAVIAADEDLFDFVRGWKTNADHAEDNPEMAGRFLKVLQRVKPVTKTLYRGEQPYRDADNHTRSFHSWSANRDTALDFAGSTGRVRTLTKPFQGVSLEAILTWRARITAESNYGGDQAEWFVVDQ